jgi:hypothetical protein
MAQISFRGGSFFCPHTSAFPCQYHDNNAPYSSSPKLRKSIYVPLCKSDLVLDYSIKLQVPEECEGDISIEL